MLTVFEVKSLASKDKVSSNLSIMVWSLLAPIFSVLSFTCQAISAILAIAESLKFITIFSVFYSALYCSVMEKSGSFKMRLKSSILSAFNSTLIGSLPCNSGIRSEGLDK